jgi:hypothetical protein
MVPIVKSDFCNTLYLGRLFVRKALLVSRAMPTRLSYPLLQITAASWQLRNRTPLRLPPVFLSAAAPDHISCCSAPAPYPIHFAHHRRRGRGGLRLRPHPARPSVGRGDLRAVPHVYAGPLLSTSPGHKLAGYRSPPPGRLWPPADAVF